MTTVGLTSGASVPEILVRDVVERLRSFGYTQVERVETVSEDIRFTLPKNLRADLKATGIQPDRPHKVREQKAGGAGTAAERSPGRWVRNAGARNRRVFDGGAQAERAEPASGRRRADTT